MVFAPIVRVSRSGASGRIGRPRVARQRSGWLSYKCHVATMIGARCHHCRRSATPKALRVGFRAIHAGPHASARRLYPWRGSPERLRSSNPEAIGSGFAMSGNFGSALAAGSAVPAGSRWDLLRILMLTGRLELNFATSRNAWS